MKFISSRAWLLASLLSAGTAVACSGNISDPNTNDDKTSTETPSDDPFAPAAAPSETGSAETTTEGTDPTPAPNEDSGATEDPGNEDTGATEDPETPPTDSGTAAPKPPADSGTAAPKPPADSGTAAPKPPADSGTVTDTAPPTPPTPPVVTGTTEYAPYFYSWGWGNSVYPFTSLVDMAGKTGLKHVTLAFVTASGGCAASTGISSHTSDISAFRALGGKVKASFGGASGTYLENACTTSASLAAAITKFVDATGITDLDFDVEQSVATTAAINERRSAALAQVQKAKGIKVSFTLQASPSGMSSGANATVKAAVAAGVNISHVNLMVMDYGTSISNGKKMGDMAISAVESCAKQLKAILPSLSDAQTYAMIGATPMIGTNDVPSEVFTLDDAKQLVAFAKSKGLGLLSFWAIQRDAACKGAVDLVTCTGSQTANYQYNAIFKTVL